MLFAVSSAKRGWNVFRLRNQKERTLSSAFFLLAALQSGCRDSNPGPLDPQSSALTKLRHSPFRSTCIKRAPSGRRCLPTRELSGRLRPAQTLLVLWVSLNHLTPDVVQRFLWSRRNESPFRPPPSQSPGMHACRDAGVHPFEGGR